MKAKESNIRRAVEFMINAHDGQFRKFTGEEYAWHPVGVAKIVRNLKKSKNKEKICIAALLHDTVEDTDVTLDDIQNEFGEMVSSIVFELTSDGEKIKILGFPIIDERIVPKSEEILKISEINTSDVETLIEIWKREADLFTARLKINNLLKGNGIKKIYSKKLNSFAYYVDTGNKDDSTIIFTNSVMTVENLNEL